MKEDLSIRESIVVKATPQEVWHAWTDSDELENWWGEDIILEPKVGGKFQEKWEDDEGQKQLASGKVLKLKKFEFIAFSWREKNWPSEVQTVCEIQIKKENSKVQIQLAHSGWESLPIPLREKTLNDFKIGWSFHLKELKAYLDE